MTVPPLKQQDPPAQDESVVQEPPTHFESAALKQVPEHFLGQQQSVLQYFSLPYTPRIILSDGQFREPARAQVQPRSI